MSTAALPSPARQRVLIAVALFAVYVVWGSTYLGIRFGLKGFPPFLLNGSRLLVAGVLLYPIARRTGRARPTPRQWRDSAIVGGILFIGGLGLVAIAADNGVGSGVIASAVAAMPLWAALWSGLFGRWPNRLEWAGLGIGFPGVLLLSREGDFEASTLGLVLVVVSPFLWAFGSVLAGRLRLPSGLMAAAAQMITGGVLLLVGGLLRGETMSSAPGAGAWLAWGYLAIFGSLFAYTAYAYLLATVRPALATSYAYVNPVVAVLLGVTIGKETIGAWAYAGLAIILAGVAVVGLAQRETRIRAPRP
jgi:drug/metabolite transporter (DMT)-like permease